MTKFRFSTAFTILFVLIAIFAMLTWVIPAGENAREMNDSLGVAAPVPGSYRQVEPNRQGITDVILASIAGMYDPALLGSASSAAMDVAVFVLVIGGFLMVVSRTGAIDAGVGALLIRLGGREHLMIPILMTAFALGGTSFGMAEETLAFYALIIPVFIRAGYDALTRVAVIMLGAGIGTLGSTFNAFATVVALQGAGIAFTQGIVPRALILVVCLASGIVHVMRYAHKVKAGPVASLVSDMAEENRTFFLKSSEAALPSLTPVRSIILALFGLTFGVMVIGVVGSGWWMAEMTGLFLAMSVIVWSANSW